MSRSTRWFLVILGMLALFAFGVTIVILSVVGTGDRSTITSGFGDKIGLVEIKGVISSSENTVRQIKSYREDSSVRALLLRIDSPGGGVAASQEIYEEVRKTRDSGTPVVVSMGAIAASGGYYIACGASRIVANRGTLTGSIGVISEFLQVSEALGKLGVSVNTIKAGALKDAGSPTKEMTAQDRAYFQALMDEVHEQFIGVVAAERQMTREEVRPLADGSVMTGEAAVAAGLIDTVGTYEDAMLIAAEMAGIEGEPALVRERVRRSFWDGLFGETEEAVANAARELLDRPVLSYRYVGP
jgi:protease-4